MWQGTLRQVNKMPNDSVIARIDKDLATEMKKVADKTGRSQIAISRELSKILKGEKPKIEWRFKV